MLGPAPSREPVFILSGQPPSKAMIGSRARRSRDYPMWTASAPGIMCQDVVVAKRHLRRPPMEQVTTIGLDIAKHVFQVHGIDTTGKVLIRRKLHRL